MPTRLYCSELTCDLAGVRLQRYVESGLSPAAALALAEHVDKCPRCAQRLALIRLTLGRHAAGTLLTRGAHHA